MLQTLTIWKKDQFSNENGSVTGPRLTQKSPIMLCISCKQLHVSYGLLFEEPQFIFTLCTCHSLCSVPVKNLSILWCQSQDAKYSNWSHLKVKNNWNKIFTPINNAMCMRSWRAILSNTGNTGARTCEEGIRWGVNKRQQWIIKNPPRQSFVLEVNVSVS